ncbi:MAG TPA: OPT/YSL family transporter [Anaeromyxobacteraceae bacterium]|nr:OPT/YSL family transporter [Anaeromyxobacteraceae bacterium]
MREPSTLPTGAAPSPEHKRELTVRAVVVAIFVSALVGASYPTVVLRIGYGPNVSIIAAFLGYIALTLIGIVSGIRGTRWENNMVQAAGTAAGQSGFMVVVLAAMDMLSQRGLLSLELSPMQIFTWLSVAGLLGVLLAVPLRKHYVDEENLTFADGTAAGETMLVLDQGRKEAGPRLAALGIGGVVSAAFAILRDAMRAIPGNLDFTFLLSNASAVRVGTELGVLSLGAGLLVGLRIGVSMMIGMILAWVIAPGPLVANGIVPDGSFNTILQRWIMWPATGLMVAGGLTALVLKWPLIMRTFRELRAKDVKTDATDFPIKWVIWGSIGLSILLAVVQHVSLDFPIWLTVVSIGLSIILMLVGIRVLGETNWAPISAMANVMQAVFAALAPGSISVNMIGSGMSGTVAANGEHLMQAYRSGKIVGSTNRNMTYLQLIGVPIGAAAVAIAYPAVKARYGIGGEGLTSPISVKWAGFAELLGEGWGALAPSALQALVVALVLGIAITLAESNRTLAKWMPSPTAVGLGMLIPGYAVVPMFVGGLVQWLWARSSPKTEATYNTPLASGFITGEAIVVLFIALYAAFG